MVFRWMPNLHPYDAVGEDQGLAHVPRAPLVVAVQVEHIMFDPVFESTWLSTA